MADPPDAGDDTPTDGIRLLEAALSTVFEEGTVVGAFLCLSIAVLYVIWRIVVWLLTLQRSRAAARSQEAQAKRLQEMAAAMERARAEERARYAANPFRFHVPGSVSFDEVMRGSPAGGSGAAGDHGSAGPFEGRRSVVSMRSPMVSAYAAAAAVPVSNHSGSSGSAASSAVGSVDRGPAAFSTVTTVETLPESNSGADAAGAALAASGISVRRLGSGSKSNRRLSAMARDAEQPSSGHIAELRKSAVVPAQALAMLRGAGAGGTGSPATMA